MLALKLQLVTAQRKGEVISSAWADFDLDEGWWTIPAEKAKNGLPHRVPLSAMALDLLQIATTMAGDSPWVVSKLLNHVENGVTAVYDRHSYDREKRQALEAWGLKLKTIVEGMETNVIPMVRGSLNGQETEFPPSLPADHRGGQGDLLITLGGVFLRSYRRK